MSISGILFNPQGRMRAPSFWKGVIILTAIQLVMSIASAYGPFSIMAVMSFIGGIAIIYMYVCVYGKRLHDAGLTAWLVLAFAVGAFILQAILGMILNPILLPEATVLQEDMNGAAQAGDFAAMMELMSEITRASLPVTIITLLIGNLAVAAIAANLKSDPEVNEHGPPEGFAASTFD